MKFFVSEEESEQIERQMKKVRIPNRSEYLRKVASNAYVLHIDYSYLKEHTRQIRMIGVNINQIAHHLNAAGDIHRNDIDFLKKMLEEIWQLQRSILLSLRLKKP